MAAAPLATDRRLARYAWAVLAWLVVVVLWGAFVRATGSGAGCGRHWPRCDGEVIPRLASVEQVIEYTHRATSGLAGILVLGLLAWAWRALPRRHPARAGAAAATVLLVMEALIGAGLVKLELVAGNQSAARVWWMAAHLVNTFLLLGAVALTAWWASGGARVRLRGQGALAWVLGAAVVATILVGVTGAVTALGDTLFPKTEVGLAVAPAAHFLERLRVVHPVVAILTGVYVVAAGAFARKLRPDAATARLSHLLAALFAAQLAAGAVNVVLLAPVWMQLVHLLLADAVWIALVCTTASALAERPVAVAAREVEAADTRPAAVVAG
ncbi:MAG TPA: COX15/CtaA family protein [Longimicrobium sp.]|jgi:heme A synthase